MRQLKINKTITNRESASLDRYLTEIGKETLITAEEETELAKKIREGDEKALEKLTVANLRFVVSVAKQYQNQGLSLPDLINEGNMGLIKAAKRFDETRGFKFISYAVWWIRQSVMQAVAEQSRMIRLPLNKVGAVSKIKKMQAFLEQELEREPTNGELAEALTLSEYDISVTIQASSRHISTDTAIFGDEMKITDLLPDEAALQPDAFLIAGSRSIEIQRALSTLGTKERDIVTLFYGIGKNRPYTLEEIGHKYELTRERVRQIKEKAIRHLKQASRNKNLKAFL